MGLVLFVYGGGGLVRSLLSKDGTTEVLTFSRIRGLLQRLRLFLYGSLFILSSVCNGVVVSGAGSVRVRVLSKTFGLSSVLFSRFLTTNVFSSDGHAIRLVRLRIVVSHRYLTNFSVVRGVALAGDACIWRNDSASDGMEVETVQACAPC